MNTEISYKKVITSLKQRKKGAVAADICAQTALPLTTVNELLSKAADEFSGHLKVTESGEIQYYFPGGYTSRYKGFKAVFSKVFNKITSFFKKASVLFFKIWIMVMLIGYFILFIAIAVASILVQIAARSNNSSSSSGDKGGFFGLNLFNLIFRIWFFNEITKPRYSYDTYGNFKNNNTKTKHPMHKAIFSFVFGEEDPNKDWDEVRDKAVIAFLQANRGVISLSEYMALTGDSAPDAEKNILAFCSKFEGRAEITEEGTIIYCFDKLLLSSDKENFSDLIPGYLRMGGSALKGSMIAPPVKRLKTFSDNSKKMNGWFIAINAVNFLFGSYFLYQSFAVGKMIFDAAEPVIQGLYGTVHYFLNYIMSEPHNFIRIVLGFIPLIFSLFFWIIPAVRNSFVKKENKKNKLSNFKRFCFSRIFNSPKNIDIDSLEPKADECFPDDYIGAKDKIIKEICAYSKADIDTGLNGKFIYSFNDLEIEKEEVRKFRESVDLSKSDLGKTVFDTNE